MAPQRPGHPGFRGRGSAHNPANRFETRELEVLDPGCDLDPDCDELEGAAGKPGEAGSAPPQPRAPTRYLNAPSRSVIARNESPDLGFEASLNPYRGCEHGCVYCYARPSHEYLGFSAGLDFETQILVKRGAPEQLRRALTAPGWTPRILALSGVTDPYQPAERDCELTRRCLEVLLEFRHPVQIITKSHLVTRDVDLLAGLARHHCAAVALSVTTLDADLAQRMEPRAAAPPLRLRALAKLTRAGIPAGVLVAPVLPGLTEHEIPRILMAARRAGASFAGYALLRLPYAVKELFADWLERHVPERRDKVLGRIRALRGGRLNDPRFGSRLRGEGPFAEQIAQLFDMGRRRAGIPAPWPELSTRAFRRPGSLFSAGQLQSKLTRHGE